MYNKRGSTSQILHLLEENGNSREPHRPTYSTFHLRSALLRTAPCVPPASLGTLVPIALILDGSSTHHRTLLVKMDLQMH